MITTGKLFQNFIFYATHQTPEKIVENLFFHYVLHRENRKLCSTILAVTTDGQRHEEKMPMTGDNLQASCKWPDKIITPESE